MLKSSEFNSAVPKFTNGNYASNPIDPTNIEEPSAQDYVRGAEPLDTLPAQWWNWLCNQFTSRFNKLNTYVKNIFDELTGFLSLLNITPDGTESAITTGQLKNAFKEDYPTYVSNKLELGTTYVKQTTTVNRHALSGDVTVSKSDVGLGNVPNVSTNDQTPTYTEASSLTALSSGEKLSIAFGKLAKAVSSLISHIANVSNPHSVTKAQVGLGSVVNTGDSSTPVENGTTKFTTGGAYTELGKKINGYTISYTNGKSTIPTNKYILIFERTAPATYYALALHLIGEFGKINNTDKQFFDILIDFRNAQYGVILNAVTNEYQNIFDVIATWDNDTSTARVYLEIRDGYASASINAIDGMPLLGTLAASSSMLGTPSAMTFLSQYTIVQKNVKDSLAPFFRTSVAYAVGNCVLYNSLLYKCTTAHSAGTWDPSHFTAVNLSSLYNELYNDINKPSIYYFSNSVATDKTIHLGSFSASTFEQYGVNITIEGTRADGSAKMEASVSNGRLYIAMASGNTSNIFLRMFKTDSTHADLYLEVASYMNTIYVKYTNNNHYTHDGSEVNSYSGTEVFPVYTLSSVAPTFNTTTSYAVGDMITYDGVLYTCTTSHSAGVWNPSNFTMCNFNTELAKKFDKTSAGDQVTYSLSGNTLTITSLA